MDAILVLMQVGMDDDWTDRGLPEVVSDFGRAASAREAGVQWLLQNHPNASGGHWRLLVWELSDRPYHRDRPDAVIAPSDYQRATERSGSARSGRRRAPRLPHGRVVHKVPAGEDLLGQTILITQDVRNNSAAGAQGPWYVAGAPGPDTVAARVHRVAELDRGDRTMIRLGTKAGEVGWVPLGHGVIPVE